MTDDQCKWISRMVGKPALKGLGSNTKRREFLHNLVETSGGKCRWTGLPLHFNPERAGCVTDKDGNCPPTDPLYAEVDHCEPGSNECGHELVCHYINDAKGHLPWKVWLAASRTQEFKDWIAGLQQEHARTGSLVPTKSLEPTT